MSPYLHITLALIIYPVAGYLLIRFTERRPLIRKIILFSTGLISLLVITGLFTQIITIFKNLNWFLLTFLYLFLSLLLWLTQFPVSRRYREIWRTVLNLIFGLGFYAATLGFFFTYWASANFDTQQRIWLNRDLLFTENYRGHGMNGDFSTKVISVYEKIPAAPFLARRIFTKRYAELGFFLNNNFTVVFDDQKGLLKVGSHAVDKDTFRWIDSFKIKHTDPE